MVLLMDDLRRRGFIDGQNLTVNYRVFQQHPELIPEYAAQLVKAEADVLFIGGGSAIRAVRLCPGGHTRLCFKQPHS